MSIHLFQYDIPEVRVRNARTGRYYSRAVMPNPSARLWRAGAVRITLSCWFVHDNNIPYTLLAEFRRNGVRWETAPFDPSAAESLARMAVTNIRKEIADYVQRARETAARESAALARVDAEGSATETAAAHKRYRSQLAAVARRVRNCLQRVQHAAARFGITPEQLNVPDASAALAGIKQGMEARATAFAEVHDIIVRANGKGDHMAKAIAADVGVFGPIAADYVQDMGGEANEAAASRLRRVFDYDF